jgi:hypothetical protein
MLFADVELAGLSCILVFLGGIAFVLYSIGSAAQAVGEAASAAFQQAPEEVTRGVVEGVLWNFFGND